LLYHDVVEQQRSLSGWGNADQSVDENSRPRG
jgi:hypothetical protein